MTLADQIRAHLDGATGSYSDALLAVVDKCEQMRAESEKHPGGVGWVFADMFEQVIVRELGIEP